MLFLVWLGVLGDFEIQFYSCIAMKISLSFRRKTESRKHGCKSTGFRLSPE